MEAVPGLARFLHVIFGVRSESGRTPPGGVRGHHLQTGSLAISKRRFTWDHISIPAGHVRTWVMLGVLVTSLLSWLVVSRAFSVSCGDDACLTLRELRDGAPLPEAIHLYDRDGRLVSEVAGPLRNALTPDEIPPRVADAFVAVEDRRFWAHEGVDALGVVRAALRNLRAGEIEEGASTIPMQLVRTLWAEPLRDVGRWRRKVIEARTAPRLIDELGHERVLNLYLNSIYLGNGLYGIGRAAQHYFGTTVDSLSVGQLATLVGMTRAPEHYDPIRHPERARALRNTVLATLREAGVVTDEEVEAATAAELKVAEIDPAFADRRARTHLTAAVMRELRRVVPDLAGSPGLHVYTTIDAQVQAEGEAAVAAQVAAIEDGRYGRYEVADSTSRVEAAGVALDPSTGAVLAWIGGRDFETSEFDRVEQASRQIGSLVKPFLVATALEQGYAITDLVSADTVPIATSEGPWLPADHVMETVLPLREALVRSSNRAAAHLGVSLGLDQVARIAERGGLSDRVPALPSSSIGAFDASLLEVTTAFASFGNGGMHVKPHLVTRIVAPDGALLWERAESMESERVMDERTAFVVLDAMRAVVDRGTGYPIRAGGYWGPAAGKTGTTNDSRDAWFVGLTPALAAGIWIGFDQPREIVRGRGGGDLAAPAWGSWMKALERTPRSIRAAWIPPPGVQRVRYDVRSGEAIDLRCDVRLGIDYEEAWVHTDRYEPGPCRRPSWLRRMWRGIVPQDPEPLTRSRGRRSRR